MVEDFNCGAKNEMKLTYLDTQVNIQLQYYQKREIGILHHEYLCAFYCYVIVNFLILKLKNA